MEQERPRLRRRRWLWALTAPVVMCLLGGAFQVWRMNPTEARIAEAKTSLHISQERTLDDMLALSLRVQPAGENARPVYERILREHFGRNGHLPDMTNELQQTMSALRSHDLTTGRWDDPRHDEDKARLAALAHLLPLVDAAADLPGFAVRYSKQPPDQPHRGLMDEALATTGSSPVYFFGRQWAHWHAAVMRSAAEDGEWDEVVRRFRTILGIGRQTSLQATLIECMLSASITDLGLGEIRHLLIEHAPPVETCEALLEAIRERAWPGGPLTLQLEGELLLLLDMAECMDHALWLKRSPSNRAKRLRENVEIMRAHLMPRWTMEPQGFIDQHPQLEKEFMVNLLLPSLGRVLGSSRQLISEQAATAAMLRICMYEWRRGGLPAQLTDAMSPAEATDPVTGAMFEYRILPTHREGVRYSLVIPLPSSSAGEHLWPEPIEMAKPRPRGSWAPDDAVEENLP